MSKPVPTPKISPTDRLGMTLFMAVVLHGIVILGITFTAHLKQQSRQQEPLDIVIVHTSSEEAPDDVRNIAQFNQQASGRTDKKSRPSEPLAALTPSQSPGTAPVLERMIRKQERQISKQKYLTSETSETRINAQTDSSVENNTVKPDIETTRKRNLEMAKLAAEIAEKEKTYAQRPKIHFIDAQSAKSDIAANYMSSWVKRVEGIGNLNYPAEARINKISGKLTLHVLLNQQGKVIDVQVAVSSGSNILDDAAIKIVRIASPFPAFSREMREKYDQLMITRTWKFRSS